MILIIVGIVGVALIAGICFFNNKNTGNKVSRQKYLEQLCEYTEGTLESMEEHEDAFQVSYDFDGKSFVFEDRFVKGFKHALYRGFLRTKIKPDFFMAFTYRVKKAMVRSEMTMMSNYEGCHRVDPHAKVKVTEALKNFEVFTNQVSTANQLLKDKKIAGYLKEWISINSQGSPFVSLKIIDHEVFLDFHEYSAARPSLEGLKTSIPSIEDYTEKILYIAKKVEEFARD